MQCDGCFESSDWPDYSDISHVAVCPVPRPLGTVCLVAVLKEFGVEIPSWAERTTESGLIVRHAVGGKHHEGARLGHVLRGRLLRDCRYWRGIARRRPIACRRLDDGHYHRSRAPQLSRPSDGSGKLDYSNPAAWQPNGQDRARVAGQPQVRAHAALPSVSVCRRRHKQCPMACGNRLASWPAQLPSNFTGAPRQMSAAPVGTAFDPQQPAPIDGINENNILGVSGTIRQTRFPAAIHRVIFKPLIANRPTCASATNSNSSANQPSMRSGGRPAPADSVGGCARRSKQIRRCAWMEFSLPLPPWLAKCLVLAAR